MEITEKQWERIEAIIKRLTPLKDSRGRPSRPAREVLNGILWVMRSGARWKDMPDKYPPYQTCHRRFQQWVRQGVFQKIVEEFGRELYEEGKIDIREAFIDGSFAPAKKGVLRLVKQSVGKVRS